MYGYLSVCVREGELETEKEIDKEKKETVVGRYRIVSLSRLSVS